MRCIVAALAGVILLAGCTTTITETSSYCDELSEKLSECRREKYRLQDEMNLRVLRHVVLFKFKPDATPEQIQEVVRAFQALPDKIDVIHDFEWGTDVSVENLQDGFTHCFIVTFKSESDRDAYLPHPAHKEFVALLRPHLDKALVVDFWAND